jgi:RimJ/RimL family protein N-acetyltransferase
MLTHAFRFVDSVIFLVGPNNVRSQRAMEKIGGVREGLIDRRGRTSVLFRIRKGDPSVATAVGPR